MDPIPASALADHFVQAFKEAAGATISDDRQWDLPFRRSDGLRRLDLLLHMHTEHLELDLAVELKKQGYLRDGPKACAVFTYGRDAGLEEERVLEQRNVSGLVSFFEEKVREKISDPQWKPVFT